jgi:hypothetical protein
VWEIVLDLAFVARDYDDYFKAYGPFDNMLKDVVRKAAFSLALLLGCHMTDRFSRLNFLHYWETSVKNMQLKDEIRTLNMAGQRNEAWGAMLNTPMERILRELRLLSRSNPKDVPVKHRRVLQDIVSILSSTISLDLPDIVGQLAGAGGGDMISQNLLYTLGGQSGKRASAPTEGLGAADGKKSSLSQRVRKGRTQTVVGASEDACFHGGLTHATMMTLLEDWSLDLVALNKNHGGAPLHHVSMAHFIDLGIDKSLSVRRPVFDRFVKTIEAGYFATNPYHNAMHAADVVHGTMYLLNAMGASSGSGAANGLLLEGGGHQLSDEEIFSALVASIVHDYHHPGHTSAYIVKTQQPLAVRYSDDSPIERMHLAESFFIILQSDGCNIFESFDEVSYVNVRLSAGRTRVLLLRTGARVSPFAPSALALVRSRSLRMVQLPRCPGAHHRPRSRDGPQGSLRVRRRAEENDRGKQQRGSGAQRGPHRCAQACSEGCGHWPLREESRGAHSVDWKHCGGGPSWKGRFLSFRVSSHPAGRASSHPLPLAPDHVRTALPVSACFRR